MKKIISWAIGIPAGILAVSETSNELWWTPFVALGIVLAILRWNGILKIVK